MNILYTSMGNYKTIGFTRTLPFTRQGLHLLAAWLYSFSNTCVYLYFKSSSELAIGRGERPSKTHIIILAVEECNRRLFVWRANTLQCTPRPLFYYTYFKCERDFEWRDRESVRIPPITTTIETSLRWNFSWLLPTRLVALAPHTVSVIIMPKSLALFSWVLLQLFVGLY